MKTRRLIVTCTIESDQKIADLRDGISLRFDPGFGALENLPFSDLKVFSPDAGPRPKVGGRGKP